jgi:hypothetical protein
MSGCIKINGGTAQFHRRCGSDPVHFTPVAKKIGLESDKGWATLDKLEIEAA